MLCSTEYTNTQLSFIGNIISTNDQYITFKYALRNEIIKDIFALEFNLHTSCCNFNVIFLRLSSSVLNLKHKFFTENIVFVSYFVSKAYFIDTKPH
jgi:hypothetical protein